MWYMSESLRSKAKHIKEELFEHLPITVFSAAMGVVFCGILAMSVKEEFLPPLFDVFHATHLLFSSAATSSMFLLHEKKFIKAALVTFFGVTLACTTSDILLPYAFAKAFSVKMHLHICALEHPLTIFIFIGVGFLCGAVSTQKTSSTFFFSHLMHVLLSSVASLLYLACFGFYEWMNSLGLIFLIVIFSVMLLCCLSDIIFPLLISKC